MRRAVPALLGLVLVGCAPTLSLDSPTPSHTAQQSAFGEGPQSDVVKAEVVDVVDGDTIKVRVDGQVHSLRYIGIDSPERGEPGAKSATSANANLVAGKIVALERDTSETDRFGRLLRYVWIQRAGEWVLVNRALVRQGYAQAKAYPPDTEYQTLLERAEKEARATS